MIGEISIFGFYMPLGIVMAIAALAVASLISRTLARFGVYRYVWHPALFDLAIFVIVMGIFFVISSLRGS
ncbi:MAG: DUF1656 domain-containing protein [Burkholderiaceae bacterium]|nr:DUF1656 domain-containing protein [Burkholderiaceae bacterium]